MSITIAKATVLVSDMVDIFEQVYWESPSITIKNQCFNLVRTMQQEMTELTKVSVQDHHYDYEVITCSGEKIVAGITKLDDLLKSEVMRNQTQSQFQILVKQALSAF